MLIAHLFLIHTECPPAYDDIFTGRPIITEGATSIERTADGAMGPYSNNHIVVLPEENVEALEGEEDEEEEKEEEGRYAATNS